MEEGNTVSATEREECYRCGCFGYHAIGCPAVGATGGVGMPQNTEAEEDAALPTEAAAYWRPHANLTEVYYLLADGTWRLSTSGRAVARADVPADLTFLANYAKKHVE